MGGGEWRGGRDTHTHTQREKEREGARNNTKRALASTTRYIRDERKVDGRGSYLEIRFAWRGIDLALRVSRRVVTYRTRQALFHI